MPFHRSTKPGAYNSKVNFPRKGQYEPVPAESVPADLRWKPAPWGGRPTKYLTTMFSLGNIYKLVRVRATGEVSYFKLRDDRPATPAEKIDAEPARRQQIRYRTGARCWFVDTGDRWFLCVVVERKQNPGRITITPVTGIDADKRSYWEHGEALEFPATRDNRLFQRLRPLRDRYT